ncbi:DUF2851 family protein [Wenyingzhuangia sp. 2_MG-2023]|nr:DUF2851 family protein [Wenyingzhuangia sp. 2_MG-2023]MDO6737847.1 DUF2851 family protein [Wenyingzhuangia sp. 2_MG-2023]
MKESFLHLVWQQQLLETTKMTTSQQEPIKIHQKGVLNTLQGPDFSNALIEINNQKWAGNIEIHVKSSDWYAHKHQEDKNYQNVILHVVYDHDVEVFDQYSNPIPTLELKGLIFPLVIENYHQLMNTPHQWIFCEASFKNVDSFVLKHWLERVYVERLERKTKEVEAVFGITGNDWEATLFLTMAKYFGGNLNGTFFMDAFAQVDFATIRKTLVNKTASSLLFGLVGLLEDEEIEDSYYQNLRKEFAYQKQKYQLQNLTFPKLHFYGCRPQNFPTIRLAQLIAFYETYTSVFVRFLNMGTEVDTYKQLFDITMELYWQMHYNFDKSSKKSPKKISKSFVDLLLINVVVPVLFLHKKTKGEDATNLLELMYQIPAEKNTIVEKFKQIGAEFNSALETQALLTLKKEYCNKERCTECTIGITCVQT